MISNGITLDLILYAQVIFWFIAIGYLTYLTITTKLTYVGEFRKLFSLGIFILLGTVSIFFVSRYFFSFSPEFYNSLVYILFINMIITIVLIIISITKLNDYFSSLIEYERNISKLKIFLISLVPSYAVASIGWIFLGFSSATILDIFLIFICYPCLFAIFYTTSIYCFLLHEEIKALNLNFLIYFGLAFFSFALIQVPYALIVDINHVYFWIGLNFCIIGLTFFFILGFLNFKHRTQNLQ